MAVETVTPIATKYMVDHFTNHLNYFGIITSNYNIEMKLYKKTHVLKV